MRAGNREQMEIPRPVPVRTPATKEQLRWALSPGEPAELCQEARWDQDQGLRIPSGLRGQMKEEGQKEPAWVSNSKRPALTP